MATATELKALNNGDIVRGKHSGQAYTVISNDGRTVVAVRSITVTNPEEWDIVRAAKLLERQ